MSRTVPYRVECTEKCLQAQNDALNSTFFILRQTGPTAFIVKGDNEKIFKVFLGDEHQCSCPTFQRDRELCKHICWLLLKRFRIPRTNSMVWQRGLVEREINEILRGLIRDDEEEERKKFNRNYQIKNDDGTDVDNEVEQRLVNENDVCPICQEEFMNKKLPVTYCRYGCGNNIHIKCMKIWLDHQVLTNEKTIKCPLCRETFNTLEQLKLEFRASGADQAERASIHLGYSCHRCRACPIRDKCYKCTTCENYFLCQKCFNSNIHNEHSFDYREKSFQRWKIATREHLTALSNALHQMLINREINENDYEILLQLENTQNTAIMGVPENVVKAMPTEHVHDRSQLLQHGEQCRLCLKSYQVGERIRRLPCKHKFHLDCIDGWLLHSHPTCPIDGQHVWNVEMENKQRERKHSLSNVNRNFKTKNTSTSSLVSVNMGLTIMPYRIQSAVHQRSHLRTSFRSLITATPIEFPLPLEINGRSLRNSQNKLSLSNEVEQRQFRRQSILSSPSLLTKDIRRVNVEYKQYWTSSTDNFPYRLQRSRSNAK